LDAFEKGGSMKGKFLTTAILATLLVGSNSFASIARQAVLGGQPTFISAGGSGVATDAVNGSLWYDGDYNVFYNPSYINDNKNYVTVEKGGEGGFFKSEFENFAYGVYFNRGQAGDGGTVAAAPNAAGAEATYGGTSFVSPGLRISNRFVGTQFTALSNMTGTIRPIDLFFGGDTGLKWGMHLSWAYNRDQSIANKTASANNESLEASARYWHVDLGTQIMGFEPFVGLTFASKAQMNLPTTNIVENLDEFNVGFRYKYEGWTPYATFKKYRKSGNGNPAAVPNTLGNVSAVQPSILSPSARMNIWGVGIGHDTKVADGVHIYKNIGFWQNSVLDDTRDPTNTAGFSELNSNYKDMIVPLNVAVEGEATSWLTLLRALLTI